MNFNSLNDDCVLEIFRYLSPLDLFETEKVCSKWKEWTAKAWAGISKTSCEVMSDFKHGDIRMLLSKCGKYLLKYNYLGYFGSKTTCIEAIAKYCPQLEGLNLLRGESKWTKDVLIVCASRFRSLKEFATELEGRLKEASLAKLFRRNKDLQSVRLHHCRKITGVCLEALPVTLRELNIMHIRLASTHVVQCLDKCKTLRSLCLDGDLQWSDNFEQIVTAAPQLEQLTLTSVPFALQPITDFTLLKSLFLYGNRQLTDGTLQIICESCKALEVVGLGNLNDKQVQPVTEKAFIHLAALPNLRQLVLRFMYVLDRNFIPNLAPHRFVSLQVLEVHSCYLFDDVVALHILQSCENLKRLDILECTVSVKTIENAVNVLKMQPNRQSVLELGMKFPHLGGDVILKAAGVCKHPLLRVSLIMYPGLDQM